MTARRYSIFGSRRPTAGAARYRGVEQVDGLPGMVKGLNMAALPPAHNGESVAGVGLARPAVADLVDRLGGEAGRRRGGDVRAGV